MTAITNRFVCVHLDGKNGWRDPHSGQVVHRLEWSFEDLDSGRRITSDDLYNVDSDYQKERRKRFFGGQGQQEEEGDLIVINTHEHQEMTMIPEEVHHDIEKKDVDDNISGSIRKTEYDRDVYFHLLATEMVDEYDEEKGYKFIKDKYPEFDHRLDKDVHRLSSNDVESFNFVENWDIDLDEEDDLVLDYFS